MDVTDHEFLAIAVIICGAMGVALSSVLNCAKRENARNRKVLRKKSLSNASQYQHLPSDNIAETSKGLNISWCNLNQQKDTSKSNEVIVANNNSEKMIELIPTTFISLASDINVNSNKLEEQTAIAKIHTPCTQMTNTYNLTQSRDNLNSNVNLNRTTSKSNNIIEIAADKPNGFESEIDEKSIMSKEKSWNSGQYYPTCSSNENIQIQVKPEKIRESKMIDEYTLSESVAEMVQKYEQKVTSGN